MNIQAKRNMSIGPYSWYTIHMMNLLDKRPKILDQRKIDFISTQIRYMWDEFNCTWTNNCDQIFNWIDQMVKLNDQKTKLTLQSAYFFRQDEIE